MLKMLLTLFALRFLIGRQVAHTILQPYEVTEDTKQFLRDAGYRLQIFVQPTLYLPQRDYPDHVESLDPSTCPAEWMAWLVCLRDYNEGNAPINKGKSQ